MNKLDTLKELHEKIGQEIEALEEGDGLPETWEELDVINGYSVDDCSKVAKIESNDCVFNDNTKHHFRNIYRTEEQAKAARAMAQLSQLMYVYNEEWVPNWEDGAVKYVIYFWNDKINISSYTSIQRFLAFKTPEIRALFLERFRGLILEARPLL